MNPKQRVLNPELESERTRTLLFLVLLFVSFCIGLAIVMGVRIGKPLRYFGEHQFITWISAIQLLVIAWFSYKIFHVQVKHNSLKNVWRSPAILWLMICPGFVFLAFDDYCSIHENVDRRIHHVLGIHETGLTDRIDDVLVGLYGIIGVVTLYHYRSEIARYRQMLPYLVVGFFLFFAMVVLVIVTDRMDILTALMRNDLARTTHLYFGIAEDSCKVLAESFFLTGFYQGCQLARGTVEMSLPFESALVQQ